MRGALGVQKPADVVAAAAVAVEAGATGQLTQPGLPLAVSLALTLVVMEEDAGPSGSASCRRAASSTTARLRSPPASPDRAGFDDDNIEDRGGSWTCRFGGVSALVLASLVPTRSHPSHGAASAFQCSA
jgi:hypothetical protein